MGGIFLLFLFSFPVAILSYNHLGEDAFITFRYAEQFARGNGLVYNVGERVEGFSNPLWTALMVPFAALRMELHLVARILSVIIRSSFTVLLPLLLWRRNPQRPWLAWWAALALFFQPFLHYHQDQGLETVQYAAVLGLMVVCVGMRYWIAAAVFAVLAALSRPEGLGFVVALWPLALWELRSQGQTHRCWRTVVFSRAMVFLLAPLAMWLAVELARRVYYDAWIPNTVRAKAHAAPPLTRLLVSSGWQPVGQLLLTWWGIPALGLLGAAAVAWKRRGDDLLPWAVALSILAAVAFQLKIGDPAQVGFRYLIPVVVPSLLGLWLVLEEAALSPRVGRWGAVVLGAAAAIVLLFNLIIPFRWHSPWLVGIQNDDPRTRLHVRLGEMLTQPDFSGRLEWYQHDPILLNAEAGRWVSEVLLEEHRDAILAADQMGMFGYSVPRRTTIVDMLGLMDRHVAAYGLGGEALAEYLMERGVDFIVLYANGPDPIPGWLTEEETGRARVPWLRPTVESPPGSEAYALWYAVRSNNPSEAIQFLVYGPREGAPTEPEIVHLGVSEAEFLRRWRVTPLREIPAPLLRQD